MPAESPEVLSVLPTLDPGHVVQVAVVPQPDDDGAITGYFVNASGEVSKGIGISRAALVAAGFDGTIGSAIALPSPHGPVKVAIGAGENSELTAARLRDAAAAFARATPGESLQVSVPTVSDVSPSVVAQALVEGALLARYRYDVLRESSEKSRVAKITLVAPLNIDEVREGAARGLALANAQMVARDLATTPHSHLNATRLGAIAEVLGAKHGFGVEVFGLEELREMGCGGLLGVNQGSTEPPRLIRLTYKAESPTASIAFVGKGIMYDSGGLSLKPSDPVHAQMKNDMSGAGAILAAFTVLGELGCPVDVTAYLMCTDNMPSGTAMALGDVITMRNGTTVEVEDTDAEGRLVLADGLALAAEQHPDAVVDIATLTGSALRALGPWLGAVFGTDQEVVDQVKAAGERTDEPVWQLPLYTEYRGKLDSTVADIKNVAPIGWPDAIIASLFLSTFAGDVPWAHIDMCGTAQNTGDRAWRTDGCSGYGARLITELALGFVAPDASKKG